MTWLNIPENYDDYIGFVYLITEIDTGMKYLGIKQFWKTVKLKPLKGKKNKRHSKRESDWMSYNSSSPILQKNIDNNPDNYIKEILSCHKSKSTLKAREAYLQLKAYYDGDWDKYYNQVINLRITLK